MTQPKLTVSGQIRSTGDVQHQVADRIEQAKSAPDGASGHVFQTHGLVCSATAMALRSAESSRRNAAEKMHLISTDLAVKLNSAATEYDGTDHQEAGNLGGQMHPR
ncbi:MULTISPECIES: ESX-1 secretion-associated protein [unclassified Mycolicibacterium]|uniref:ESX-1 secretion-associated protein n=1 Tax=unclassified Mycolicibacterium TaxID=2636767 RepID=UPI0012DF28B7|nr:MULTISPECIES: ESX-1 secretion-associated protein [unclassified Mycolicibacterium]MUM26571.1 ESX-1 secretion-associated protein [Mycolicibacterium sp. CBMA 295]